MQARRGLAEAVDWRLYFVTDTALCGGPDRVPWVVEKAVRGGAGVVQVRDKHLSDDDFLALTLSCLAALERLHDETGSEARLVVNDRLWVAAELGTDLHIGQNDGDIRVARETLGPDALIGLSVSSLAELEAELADPTADVVGLSPIWDTPVKTDTQPALGLDGARTLVARTGDAVKTVAIGGINAGNARSVIETGVDGICVVSAIATAADPRTAAQELLSLWRPS
ncbi:thiamine phosphate synthase [Tessaracoccus caeni]|uniref:thiamine phosphate synthase n=1 Tax=Tessaracoccus caeni TaxID=3031239 RepID=UPI0023DCAA4E|nr:thiamine phosphate synthase [Tessaracoccus caeni]MDF1489254.1 thiamine phosphate synthase [Tessaracoccus caeni]